MVLRVALSLVLLVAIAAAPALAGEVRAYDAKAFEAAQAAGKPVVVAVHASW
jgi:thioredoxin 1